MIGEFGDYSFCTANDSFLYNGTLYPKKTLKMNGLIKPVWFSIDFTYITIIYINFAWYHEYYVKVTVFELLGININLRAKVYM